MTSEKQILSNRQNALLGGPKTAEGKAAVRLNSLSHGIFIREILLQGEDAGLLSGIRDNLIKELQPEGELETILVERIVSSSWRLRRTLRSESKVSPKYIIVSDDKKPADFAVDYRFSAWQLILRYETTIENQIYKAMHEFERLQRSRKGENIPLPFAVDLAVTGDAELLKMPFEKANPV